MAGVSGKTYEIKWLVIGTLILAGILWMALPFVTPIVFAVFVYYIARPVKQRLRRYIKNEALAALLCMLAIALPLLALLVYTLLLAVGQIDSLLSGLGIPSLSLGPLSRLGDLTAALPDIYGLIQDYSRTVQSIKNVLVSAGLVLVGAVFNLSLLVIIAFLLLVGDHRLAAWFHRTFPRAVRERNGALPRFATAVDADLEAIFFGNVISVLLFGIIAAIVYSALNFFAPDPAFRIPYPLLLGILCGLFAFLPLLGPWMIDVPLLLYVAARSILAGAFSDHWWYLAVMAISIFILVENLPNYLLRPFISHGSVDVGLLMLAYIVGPIVFGLPGLFIGAILLVLATNYFAIIVPEMCPAGP